jgi:DNA repair photolyase
MSELITRIRDLTARISDLEDSVMSEKRRYADEVDHSDNLAYLITLLHNGTNCTTFCSFCDAVKTHERRRATDYGLMGEANEESA